MAEDYANRITRRFVHVGLGDRPTPQDIDDLRRRHEEHAKRTQGPPKQSFDSVMRHQQQGDRPDGDGDGDGDGRADGQKPHDSPQGDGREQTPDKQPRAPQSSENPKVTPQSEVPPPEGTASRPQGRGTKQNLPPAPRPGRGRIIRA